MAAAVKSAKDSLNKYIDTSILTFVRKLPIIIPFVFV